MKNVAEILKDRMAFSFEVFPPKTDAGMEKLCAEGGVLDHLYELNPDQTFLDLRRRRNQRRQEPRGARQDQEGRQGHPATHFTCVANTKEGIKEQLQTYLDHGIDHMLALRGDIPFGWTGTNGDLHYATELRSSSARSSARSSPSPSPALRKATSPAAASRRTSPS